MSRASTSHVTYMNESRRTHARVMSHSHTYPRVTDAQGVTGRRGERGWRREDKAGVEVCTEDEVDSEGKGGGILWGYKSFQSGYFQKILWYKS